MPTRYLTSSTLRRPVTSRRSGPVHASSPGIGSQTGVAVLRFTVPSTSNASEGSRLPGMGLCLNRLCRRLPAPVRLQSDGR